MLATNKIFTLPSPRHLMEEIQPAPANLTQITHHRETIRAILNGTDPRILLLVGPCSIHDVEAAIEYGHRLKILAETVSDRFFCVMRCYVEKPRTTLGWKGLLYDPYLDGSYQISAGIRKTRQLLDALTKLGLPLASEILELLTAPYFCDYLSWGCIGARTSASPPHRQVASGLPFPVGFKNSVDGNIDVAIQGIITARQAHTFVGPSLEGELARLVTLGNPDCHVILRGAQQRPNYHPTDVARTNELAKTAGIPSRLVIDCSHDNSAKKHQRQVAVFEAVMQQIEQGSSAIGGVMLESFLEEGTQPLGPNLQYGVSVTDACLSWQATEQLILGAYHASCCFC